MIKTKALLVCFLSLSFTMAADWGAANSTDGSVLAYTQALPDDFFWKAEDYDSASILEVTSLGEVTLVTDSTHELVLEPNTKTLSGELFSKRLKLGGAGGLLPLPTYRALSFYVGDECAIEVFALSSNSLETRTMGFSDGTKEIFSDTVGGDHNVFPGVVVFPYTGPETEIFVYSKHSGINVYGIRVTHGGVSIKRATPMKRWDKTFFETYNIKGTKVSTTTNPQVFLKTHRGHLVFKGVNLRGIVALK